MADGSMVRGSDTPYRALTVTRRDRLDYITRWMASAVVAERGGTMAPVADAHRDAKEIAELTDRQEYAPVRPPFTDRAPIIGCGDDRIASLARRSGCHTRFGCSHDTDVSPDTSRINCALTSSSDICGSSHA